MKKVRLKLTHEEATNFITMLQNGIKVRLSLDVRFISMQESLVSEVVHKLTVGTMFYYAETKTFSLTVAQAMSLTTVNNPYKDDPYFEYVISLGVMNQIRAQIPNVKTAINA